MSFRFWKRKKIAPGVTLNLSKTGASVSLGPKGAKLTLGPKGVRATAGIPGSGIFYTKQVSARALSSGGGPGKGKSSKISAEPLAAGEISGVQIGESSGLDLSFFQKLTVSTGEQKFVDGCRELTQGREDRALAAFHESTQMADSALLAGFLELKAGRPEQAERLLARALHSTQELGSFLQKYQLSILVSLRITEELWAHVPPNRIGALLALVEAFQLQGKYEDALSSAEQLFEALPEDPLVAVSYSELLLELHGDQPEYLKTLLAKTAWADNETVEGTTLLLYRAQALTRLELWGAARDSLSLALRKRKGRPLELQAALHRERRDIYRELGDSAGVARDGEWLLAHGYS